MSKNEELERQVTELCDTFQSNGTPILVSYLSGDADGASRVKTSHSASIIELIPLVGSHLLTLAEALSEALKVDLDHATSLATDAVLDCIRTSKAK